MNTIIEVLTVGCKVFSIGCRQTGVIAEEFKTLKDAQNTLIRWEEGDKIAGIYEENFYEIRCKGELINNL